MTRDGDEGQLLTCDRCRVDYDYDDDNGKMHEITNYWCYEIFNNLQKPRCLWGDFCTKCATEMTPFVYALRDVVEKLKADFERPAHQAAMAKAISDWEQNEATLALTPPQA